jgi:hypothetical protein
MGGAALRFAWAHCAAHHHFLQRRIVMRMRIFPIAIAVLATSARAMTTDRRRAHRDHLQKYLWGTIPPHPKLDHADVGVNDEPVGQLGPLPGDEAMMRHRIQGIWVEREAPIDAALMQKGGDTLKLTAPGGNVNDGVIYDCLRLELDESVTPN